MFLTRARAIPQFLILLVEDFRPLRIAIQNLLESSHYRVRSAGTPEEALRTAGNSAIPFDLLITRLTLSGMTGPELASQIRNRTDRFSVLYMSDDSGRRGDQIFAEEVRSRSLPNPFDEKTLLSRVKNALGLDDSQIAETQRQPTLDGKSVRASQEQACSSGPQQGPFF
jgi:DNA-binding response OmpR family regulator